MSLASMKIRVEWKASDALRDAGLKIPADVERFTDIVYGNVDPKMQQLDVYRPKGNDSILPVIVSVHGGGWVYGDKELYQHYCMSLAQRGFAVVNYTYRLAPEHQFPAHLEDANTVFKWVLDHAAQYKMDAELVYALGDSAGANILSLYCLLCTNPTYAAQFDFAAPKGFAPRAVALNCGHYTYAEPPKGDNVQLMTDLFGQEPTEEVLCPLDVIANLAEGFPPAFVMTGSGDFLAEQGPVMAAKLTALGVENEYRFYTSKSGKKLGHVFHVNMRCPEGTVCNTDECEWFLKH